jgi:hypothetical protein
MDFDPTVRIVSLLPSSVGFVLFVYGKKEHRWPQLVAGLLMMVYPYFTGTLMSMAAAGTVILLALWYAVRLGL